ncbi:hypothetical protein E2C01_069896 [Portunus trituberculatus]|uniref:Uncharacterized protein n=1 Tax=Portunus trituberculatus TaxID=210409 RepID=A0A5B7I0M1_PORTR|nr:hypothetical protein [Portunus trituberculatus]
MAVVMDWQHFWCIKRRNCLVNSASCLCGLGKLLCHTHIYTLYLSHSHSYCPHTGHSFTFNLQYWDTFLP